MKKGFIYLLALVFGLVSCQNDDALTWEGEYDLSAMSFNIRYDTETDGDHQWDNRKEACVKMVDENAPHVMGIQEGLHHQVTFLDDQLEMYGYIGVGRDDAKTEGEYSAIFYRKDLVEVIESNTFWLSDTPSEPSYGWGANHRRIVTWGHFKRKFDGSSFYVFNTHFDHESGDARRRSSILLDQRISSMVPGGTPVVITGDFNMLYIDSAFQSIKDNYLNARDEALVTDNTRSFNDWGGFLNLDIDFIFYQDAKAEVFKTIDDDYGVPYVSDHYPLIAHFSFN